jgi:hypothetical protein
VKGVEEKTGVQVVAAWGQGLLGDHVFATYPLIRGTALLCSSHMDGYTSS